MDFVAHSHLRNGQRASLPVGQKKLKFKLLTSNTIPYNSYNWNEEKSKRESNVSPISISTIFFYDSLLSRHERRVNKSIHLDDLLVRRSRIEERIQWIGMRLNWIQNAYSSH